MRLWPFRRREPAESLEDKLLSRLDVVADALKELVIEHRRTRRRTMTRLNSIECRAIAIKYAFDAQPNKREALAEWNKFWGENAERITEQFEILRRIEAKYLAPGEYVSPFSGTAAGNIAGSFEGGLL